MLPVTGPSTACLQQTAFFSFPCFPSRPNHLVYRPRSPGKALLPLGHSSSSKRGDFRTQATMERGATSAVTGVPVSSPITNQSQQLILLASDSEPKVSSPSSKRSLGRELSLSPTSLWQKQLCCKRKHKLMLPGWVLCNQGLKAALITRVNLNKQFLHFFRKETKPWMYFFVIKKKEWLE